MVFGNFDFNSTRTIVTSMIGYTSLQMESIQIGLSLLRYSVMFLTSIRGSLLVSKRLFIKTWSVLLVFLFKDSMLLPGHFKAGILKTFCAWLIVVSSYIT
jgi:hypothetical protein